MFDTALKAAGLSALLAGSAWAAPALVEQRMPEHGHSPSPALLRGLESRLQSRQASVDSAYYPQYSYDVTKCQGYSLSNLQQNGNGMTASLSLQGSACNAFGYDIKDLQLIVEYQSQNRLHVHIQDAANTQWQVPNSIWPRPGSDSSLDASQSDLEFHYDSMPFAFWITRRTSGEVLFDTRSANIPTYSDRVYQNGGYINGTEMPAHPLVFEDQYLQISSALPTGANIFGNGEVIAASGIRRNSSSSLTTLFAADIGDPVDGNEYGTHPFYLEQRSTGTHGVFLLNTHGLDILQRDGVIEWRVIGGTLDFYFVSGPNPIKAIEQYSEIAGKPQQMPDWAFGFQLCRWGYTSIADTRAVVDKMRAANIPLEVQYNDIDWMAAYRNFEFDPNFSPDEFRSFIEFLDSNHQHYIPIIDAAYAVPRNDTDRYDSYTRGAELDVWLKNPDGSEYRGRVWPGITVFADYFAENIQQYWTEALQNFTQTVKFSGLWLDMNEPSSFSEGSTGSDPAEVANVSTPFALPNTPGNNASTYGFPECYVKAIGDLSGNISVGGQYTCANATELAGVQALNDFKISSMKKRDSNGIDQIPSPQVDVPAFDIHNLQGALNAHAVALNATSQNGLQQYHWHNMYGYLEELTVSNSIKEVYKGLRPFIVGRSTFAGAGRFTAHWLGDNTSLWAYLQRSIQGVLQFQIFGIPMVGADTGGFNGNTDEELNTRWHLLSGFYPFFRNHNTKGAISQEPYVWESTATAARRVLAARYSLLPYWETLFWDANAYGTPPLRPLFFAFDDPRYYGNSNQFMVGDSLLVTPALEPNVTSVVGALPMQGNTQWRNFFTHELVKQTSDIVRLDAPLTEIPVHIRSGSVILTHRDPGYTIYETKQGPYSLLVNLDSTGYATGCNKFDDGVSLPSTGFRAVTWESSGTTLKTISNDGSFQVNQTLAEIVILGVPQKPTSLSANGQQASNITYDAGLQRVIVGGLNVDLNAESTITWAY